ncbi:hypothetical protein ODJ79_25020 [Actinoplanes sp. KI2]|uniref:hypothetical protein n=1 Tax=Actinoplanes sp. KI2 TaxID=2983315 RepID=UPI0021D610A1|nr:hypothetical protein [Actinoplanes sp. KI2]MCU7727003.1 hypothetical protein [Actinoplanes sp. KI2]
MGGLMYVLADTSGSTVRDDFHEGVHLALPHLVHLAEDRGARFCLAGYGDDARIQVTLIGAGDLTMIPRMPPGGLSSLAAGLRAVAAAVEHDLRQLRSDGIEPGRPVTMVLAHGLGTDRDEQVLEARLPLAGDLHVSAPAAEDRLAFAGLGATLHPMRLGSAGTVAGSIVAATRDAWLSSGGPQ